MKTETALTVFCMTTVLVLVGLVMLTAEQTGGVSIVGNLIGIRSLAVPRIGERDSTPVQLPAVKPTDPRCYENAVKDCLRLNMGQNFLLCLERVAADCGKAYVRTTHCLLPAGFELKYRGSRECSYGVPDECRARCPPIQVDDCIRLSRSRCKIIGGKFVAIREQTQYVQAPGMPFR
jgi:hypothetical protein